MKTYITRKEAAARVRMCCRSVDRAIADGKLRHYRIGSRILTTEADVDAWIEGQACGGPPRVEKGAAQ